MDFEPRLGDYGQLLVPFQNASKVKGVPSSVTHTRVFDVNLKTSGRRFQV